MLNEFAGGLEAMIWKWAKFLAIAMIAVPGTTDAGDRSAPERPWTCIEDVNDDSADSHDMNVHISAEFDEHGKHVIYEASFTFGGKREGVTDASLSVRQGPTYYLSWAGESDGLAESMFDPTHGHIVMEWDTYKADRDFRKFAWSEGILTRDGQYNLEYSEERQPSQDGRNDDIFYRKFIKFDPSQRRDDGPFMMTPPYRDLSGFKSRVPIGRWLSWTANAPIVGLYLAEVKKGVVGPGSGGDRLVLGYAELNPMQIDRNIADARSFAEDWVRKIADFRHSDWCTKAGPPPIVI